MKKYDIRLIQGFVQFLVFSMESVRMNPSPIQGLQLLGLEMNNPHILVQVEIGVSDETIPTNPG